MQLIKFILDVDYRLPISWIMHQQLCEYKVEEKIYGGEGRTRSKNVEYHCTKTLNFSINNIYLFLITLTIYIHCFPKVIGQLAFTMNRMCILRDAGMKPLYIIYDRLNSVL
jgi:hypothetical protein